MIRISQIKLTPVFGEKNSELIERLRDKAVKLLGILDNDINELSIVKRSIDARKKDNVFEVFTVDVLTDKQEKILKKNKNPNITQHSDVKFNPVVDFSGDRDKQVAIIGFGPCGIFAAYILAINGFKPLVFERGRAIEARQGDVELFWKGNTVDPESNVQFGEGGAGTFSDGKLNTQIKDNSGIIRYVLETFVGFGANKNIIYDQKPHIGTDVLIDVVTNMRKEIQRLGGEICFEACMTDFVYNAQGLIELTINNNKKVTVDSVIFATGHSSRDTFRLFKSKKLPLEAKDFAVGYRVMHSQEQINIKQYGEKYKDYFGAASYKVTAKDNEGRGVYSFCMCPGGYVVNSSSEKNRLCINGMSYHDRGSTNANSAIIMAVKSKEIPDFLKELGVAAVENDPLIGMYFQEAIEERAYSIADGRIPVQLFKDYVDNKRSDSFGTVFPEIKGEFCLSNIRGVLPSVLENSFIQGMQSIGKRLEGFDGDDTVIAACEARTSSPIRIIRDEKGLCAGMPVFPAGEGAGYAGGITSACVDGIKTAIKVIENIEMRTS